MSSCDSYIDPVFLPEAQRFDGTNWAIWSATIQSVAEATGTVGYLDGTIPKPTPNTTTSAAPQSATPWWSTTPSIEEWKQRNAWFRVLLFLNIKNPVGLGIKHDGTAAEAWKSLTEIYQHVSPIALTNAQRELWYIQYTEGTNIKAHVSNLPFKWAEANAMGAGISEREFYGILLQSLPA